MCVGSHGDVSVCVLQDMALEAAFPQSGISRLKDVVLRYNELMMPLLQKGRLYRVGSSGALVSGSRAEGLAMDDDWGHDKTDTDYMSLFADRLGVHVPGGQQIRGESCLEFCPEGCPAAYTKLKVTDLPRLRNYIDSKKWIEEGVHRSGEQCWLNTFQAVRGLPNSSNPVSGPAAQNEDGTVDDVATLVCNRPHPDIHQFLNRPRQWPTSSLITILLQLPMLLVLVGHKVSPEFNLQARISWSHLELKLIQELPESIRQGYIACKYVVKRFLKARRGENEADGGRSRLCSYHIKTVFLSYLEKNPPSMITSTFGLFLDLLHELDECLKVRKLPHYFLAECDLLETMEDDEVCIARQVIEEILSDPLNALLTSPTDPQQIYGEVNPDSLVLAFRMFYSHPTCEQNQQDLSELLSRVDERRQNKYIEQCEIDKKNKVSGRARPIRLADSLKQENVLSFSSTILYISWLTFLFVFNDRPSFIYPR